LPVLQCLKRGIAFVAGRKREAQPAGIVFTRSRADFWVFRPAGATRYTDEGEI